MKYTWYSSVIQKMCIKHNWYTLGSNVEYNVMLDFVRNNEPTNENIMDVAKNIWVHSNELEKSKIENAIVTECLLEIE